MYGLIVGAIIKYTTTNVVTYIDAFPSADYVYNSSSPPDVLRFHFSSKIFTNDQGIQVSNKTFAYSFHSEIISSKTEQNDISLQASFDPEMFFNIILPPIIFHAGYSLKKKHFFQNFGAILTFSIIGTTLSAVIIGALMYGCVQLMPASLAASFTFLDTLYFGALISPTDPLTILAIFSQLKVDVNLYAMILGESVLNDALALVMSGVIQNYELKHLNNEWFQISTVFGAIASFLGIFSCSLLVGVAMGFLTALMTKFTHLGDWPLLESALFVLMSYAAFLIAEVCELTGVVSVLFCGICQAHYTYHNLSTDSRNRTKQLFELLNFLAENFIFTYIGVSMFTFPKHHFDPWFIIAGFATSAIGRAVNIYPLSYLLNLGRNPPIPMNFQHMLFFSGLRGAISFALAIRNTASQARQAMLTTTSLIVIITVVLQGGAANPILAFLRIPTGQGQNDENEALPYRDVRGNGSMAVAWSKSDNSVTMPRQLIQNTDNTNVVERGWLAREWGKLDGKFLKPLLTHARPPLADTLPPFFRPLGRILTTTRQYTQGANNTRRTDSDSEFGFDAPQTLPAFMEHQVSSNMWMGRENV